MIPSCSLSTTLRRARNQSWLDSKGPQGVFGRLSGPPQKKTGETMGSMRKVPLLLTGGVAFVAFPTSYGGECVIATLSRSASSMLPTEVKRLAGQSSSAWH